MSDIDNLPSPEELEASNNIDISHLPSPNDLSTPEEVPATEEPDISLLESIGRAGAKGLTGGLTGVAAGVGGAAGTFAGGKRDWESLKQAYQEALAGQRKKEKEVEEANPIVSMGSEIIGSIPTVALGAAKLGAAGVTGLLPQAGILGGAQGATTYMGDTADPTLSGLAQSTALGTGLGVVGGKIGQKVGDIISPVARKLGQQGQSLFGKNVRENLAKETEQFANNIVNSLQAEKGRVGKAYEAILDANSSKKIDLSDFITKLKDRAANLDTSLPEQARDKKAIMDLVSKVIEGPEIEKSVVSGFKPGQIIEKDTLKGFKPVKTVEEIPSAREQLENEANRLIESQKQLGKSATFNIIPSEDESLLTRILRTEDEKGPVATAKTVENISGIPSYTTIKPVIESEPFSTEIKPLLEKRLVREGGTITPNIGEAKKLRTNLGKIANEKNLSTTGEQFADQTYSDLSNILKEQIPGLAPTDAQYSALLKAGKKLGIKGNDEDIVRILQKITSNNQGKQIIVDQALGQLDNVNPQLSNQIRNMANNIDQKAEMIDKISSIGNYNILNPKALMLGLAKDFGALRVASGNIVGLAEKKLIETPAGKIVQKGITNIPLVTVTNPFIQSRVQDQYGPISSSKLSTNLYNADNDSLKNVASSLSKTPGLEFYGEHLNKAIDGNDVDAKNRVIFLILQNPQSRKLVTPESVK